MNKPVYLDYNSTTPLDPRVLEAMMPYLTGQFGNAASKSHAFGWQADEAVKIARSSIADLIGAGPEEIYFTSGATESVNLAIKGVFDAYKTKGNHIVCLASEHSAVLDTCTWLETRGAEITRLPVLPDGLADLDLLKKSLRADTLMVIAMYANNETGVIQPVHEIARIAAAAGVIYFCDASQAAGKLPIDVKAQAIPIMAFSAHKMYGPKGCGVLYISRKNPRVSVLPQIHGGGHEAGKRSGTLNVPAIAGFGKAASLCAQAMQSDSLQLHVLRDLFEKMLLIEIPGLRINGNTEQRLSHVSNLMFPGINAAELMSRMPGLAIAAGSACSSDKPEPSHVLKAMGLNDRDIKASLRFSLGRFTTLEEIEFAAATVIAACTRALVA